MLRHLRSRLNSWRTQRKFLTEFRQFSDATQDTRFPPLNWDERYPCLDDSSSNTPYDSHYVLHTAWAARVLARTMPVQHVDISSFVYFSTIVSAFVPVQFYDYRPLQLRLDGLEVNAADLTALPFADRSIDSLSCMHVVEHIGLGRYGDPIDPRGDLKAIDELKRVLAPGGQLLFVVPVGRPRILFNAHRIYSYSEVMSYFDGFSLEEFCLVADRDADGEKPGRYLENPHAGLADQQEYGCGMFLFNRHPA